MDTENPYAAPTSTPPAVDNIAKQMAGLQWPLNFSFKILSLTNQVNVTDTTGRTVCYTKQKLFKFREHVEIFTDKSRSTLLADIKTRKVIDWSARYFFTDGEGREIGSVGRKGWRSLFRAHYDSFKPGDDTPDHAIREENAMAKFFDSAVGEIPFVGLLTGLIFNPRYLATSANGQPVMRLIKKPALLESKFVIEKLDDNLSPRDELSLILSFIMMLMLERKRG